MHLKKIILLSTLSISLYAEKTSIITYKGVATDIKTGKFAFSEVRKEILNNGLLYKSNISFLDANGKTFAKMISAASKDLYSHDVKFTDDRDNRLEEVVMADKNFSVKFKKNKDEQSVLKTFEIQKNLITIPGIQNLLTKNWSALEKGEAIQFFIVVPSEKDFFKFKAQKIKELDVSGEKSCIFKIEPSNFIIGLLTEPLYLTIGKSSKRIYEYRGIHFVRDYEKWKGWQVRIRYQY